MSFPAGNASITAGGWANIDIGKYDDPVDDISQSGGLSAFNFAEFNPYAEASFAAGKATLTGGITRSTQMSSPSSTRRAATGAT